MSAKNRTCEVAGAFKSAELSLHRHIFEARCSALLTPEIPLFPFAEAPEKFGEPPATALVGDGLDEAVAALRAFALIDRAVMADERDPQLR
jgi:hypothetical protein